MDREIAEGLYLAGDNRLYEVERVEDRVGYARYLRTFSSESRAVFSGINRDEAAGTSPVQGFPTGASLFTIRTTVNPTFRNAEKRM